jgi:hypothetical protein
MRMAARRFGVLVIVASLASASTSRADIPCPEQSYCIVTYARTFEGDYNRGQPYNVVTIAPGGNGETFAAMGIMIDVFVRGCANQPIPGIPRQDILLVNSNLCICPGGNVADHATDLDGRTSFSGTLAAGGCVPSLTVFVDGVGVATLAVRTNSPDALPASPCAVDASDFSAVVSRRGSHVGEDNYTICHDYNEDGYIDASDLAFFASRLGTSCQ